MRVHFVRPVLEGAASLKRGGLPLKKTVLGGLCAILLSAVSTLAQAEIIRIANHGQAGIDAMKSTVERIEKKYGVTVEVVEYPAPDKDYLTKLLTELGAGNAPDLFSIPTTAAVADMVEAGYLAPVTKEFKAWDGYANLYDVAKRLPSARMAKPM